MDTTVVNFDQALLDATSCYLQRKARSIHPEGTTDTAGRWYPAASEHQPCCDRVRTPSRAYPWSVMLHCRTVRHIAALYGVDEGALRRAIRTATPTRVLARETRYKIVRVSLGPAIGAWTYHSLYDDDVTYTLGKTYRQAAKPYHNGGYYVRALTRHVGFLDIPTLNPVIRTLEEDFRAGEVVDIPLSGVYAILTCEVWGKCVAYRNGKEAWSYLRPIDVHSTVTVD